MYKLLIFLIAIVITETITEIITKSKLFEPLHEWFFNRRDNKFFNFIHYLLDCPYCFSVWVGTFVSIFIVKFNIVSVYIDWFIVGLLLHRLSNILHNIIDRTRND